VNFPDSKSVDFVTDVKNESDNGENNRVGKVATIVVKTCPWLHLLNLILRFCRVVHLCITIVGLFRNADEATQVNNRKTTSGRKKVRDPSPDPELEGAKIHRPSGGKKV
jgi:hypothetical protein